MLRGHVPLLSMHMDLVPDNGTIKTTSTNIELTVKLRLPICEI